MEALSFPTIQVFSDSDFHIAPVLSKNNSVSVEMEMDTESQATTARSSLNSINSMEESFDASPSFGNYKPLKLHKSNSSFRMFVAPFSASDDLDESAAAKSPMVAVLPKLDISINCRIGRAPIAKRFEVEAESDDEFEAECQDASPSAFISQNNGHT